MHFSWALALHSLHFTVNYFFSNIIIIITIIINILYFRLRHLERQQRHTLQTLKPALASALSALFFELSSPARHTCTGGKKRGQRTEKLYNVL